MTRYREILRLHSLGEPPQAIAASAGCHESTVRRVIKACERKGLSWPLPEDMGDDAISRIIYPDKYGRRTNYAEPDYEWVHAQLKRKGVNRSLLYEEYCDGCRASGETPCSITTFNQGYADWADARNITMHIGRRPAQKMEVDWALSVFIDKAHYQSFAVIGNCRPIRFPICSHRPSLSAYYR